MRQTGDFKVSRMQPQEQAVPAVDVSIIGDTPCGVSRQVLAVRLLDPPVGNPAAFADCLLIAWRYAVEAGCADLCRCCNPRRWRFAVYIDEEYLGAFGGEGDDGSWRWN
jgi:hypothetical protein